GAWAGAGSREPRVHPEGARSSALQPQQRSARGLLLGLLLGMALALGQDPAPEAAFNPEEATVARPLLRHPHVVGEGLALGLQSLLEHALVVAGGEIRLQLAGKLVAHEAMRGFDAPVEEEGGDERLVGVGPESALLAPPRLLLPPAQEQEIGE